MLFNVKVIVITLPEKGHPPKYSCQINRKQMVLKLTLWFVCEFFPSAR
jgi:hypothetical protein